MSGQTTARVVLNGYELIAPNFTQGTCAVGPVGCESGDRFHTVIGSNLLNAGSNKLVVSAYQTGGDTFGVMYEAGGGLRGRLGSRTRPTRTLARSDS
jgi:hypothetical protein